MVRILGLAGSSLLSSRIKWLNKGAYSLGAAFRLN